MSDSDPPDALGYTCEHEGCSELAAWCETCRRAWCWQHPCEHMRPA